MKFKHAFLKSAALLGLLVASQAQANATTISIPAASIPWLNSANPSLTFGATNGAMASTSAPVVISLSNDASVTFSGGAGAFSFCGSCGWGSAGVAYVDARVYFGSTYQYQYNEGTGGGAMAGSHGPWGLLPSYYMEPSTSPTEIYYGELIGAFANSAGVVVGTPFAIGNMTVTEVVPTGATEILLGDNIDGSSQPSGGYAVNYSLTGIAGGIGATPEMPTYLMGLLGLGGIAILRRRQLQA